MTVFGPIAQRSEPPAHNRSVPGSNPGGPTNLTKRTSTRPLTNSNPYDSNITVY